MLPLAARKVTKAMLSFMVEIFAGILTGLGFGVNPSVATTTDR